MTTDKAPVTVEQDFWSKVDRKGDDECWLWTGAKNDGGYGTLSTRKASHVSLEIDGRPRPPKAFALHSCDNPPCVNPKHLRWGSNKENMRDMVKRRRHHAMRREACIHGHPLSGENLIIRQNGQRGCRTCQRKMNLEYYHRHKGGDHGQGK
ncbi:hypothetical protein [Sphingobium sp. CFD-2]|uniref:hypothetical protein n=1 Tax=Sphingobium sp. CFD-2 TaxID=2878542 RepID=UPI00214C63A7|nr:hypothetical protein [Sphingobium sp. CFD-2]